VSSINEIRSVEIDGQHYVRVVMDGQTLRQHGPFATADEAESAANQFAAICKIFHQPMEICRG
jgi:hypothetical protein